MRKLVLIAVMLGIASVAVGCSASPGSDAPPFPERHANEVRTPSLSPSSPSPTPERTPGVVATLPPDAPGSQDFRDIGRYPNTYIRSWRSSPADISDCRGVGPVGSYGRWEIEYGSPAGADVASTDILNYMVDKLTASGWQVRASEPYNVTLYRGLEPGPDVYFIDCNPTGETDWAVVSVYVDGAYQVQIALPGGVNPY